MRYFIPNCTLDPEGLKVVFTAYVNENPAAFANAYFDVAWLKIYE